MIWGEELWTLAVGFTDFVRFVQFLKIQFLILYCTISNVNKIDLDRLSSYLLLTIYLLFKPVLYMDLHTHTSVVLHWQTALDTPSTKSTYCTLTFTVNNSKFLFFLQLWATCLFKSPRWVSGHRGHFRFLSHFSLLLPGREVLQSGRQTEVELLWLLLFLFIISCFSRVRFQPECVYNVLFFSWSLLGTYFHFCCFTFQRLRRRCQEHFFSWSCEVLCFTFFNLTQWIMK